MSLGYSREICCNKICNSHSKKNCVRAKEIQQIISRLEQGSLLTLLKFYPKSKPEKKFFRISRKTKQLFWYKKDASSDPPEGCINIRFVKEVRIDPCSKLLERYNDSKKWQNCYCLIIFYGKKFCLRTLTILASSSKDCHQWAKGIEFLSDEARISPYPAQIESWLSKEFDSINNGKNFHYYDSINKYSMGRTRIQFKDDKSLCLKDLKLFCLRIGYKLTSRELKEQFQEVDEDRNGKINFNNFTRFYQNIIYQHKLFKSIFDLYSPDYSTVKLNNFKKFLREKQKDPSEQEEDHIKKIVANFVRKDQEFVIEEIISFLFSLDNQIWNKECSQVYQDMTKPLNHYWIASSHNTYLTGDQIMSESSVDAYARCLRMGCRSIELDCWDGPDGFPSIYHGHTLTTKIKFLDVIRTIKEHAFVVSKYPVILSVENHCSLPQQRKMAAAFQEIFGDSLITHQIDRDETHMPSPEALKEKFIIKHKKLSENCDDIETNRCSDELNQEGENFNFIKNGMLYLLEDLDDGSKEWRPYFFMLTNTKIYYVDVKNKSDEDENEDKFWKDDSNFQSNNELHYGEVWYHAKLPRGRDQALELFNSCKPVDGTFLVRESETFIGEYSLSFWRQGQVNHCRIHPKKEKGQTKYYLIESMVFDSLFQLINYYQTHPLRSQNFSIILNNPVPQPKSHESKDWYHANITKQQAEDLLEKMPCDGAFLVRPSEKEKSSFTISFRADDKIKNCRIKQEGRLFYIGNTQFENLVELIEWYQKYPLYKTVKLKYPVSNTPLNLDLIDHNIYSYGNNYLDPSDIQSCITVRAKESYESRKSDELSFIKNDIITNVVKKQEHWWKGDNKFMKQGWFPTKLVEEIGISGEDSETAPLGILQKGSIDIVGCTVVPSQNTYRGKEWIFKLVSSSQTQIVEIAAPSEEEMNDWIQKIREMAQSVNEKIRQRQAIERKERVAKELSNLIVYCRAVPFTPGKIGKFTDMSSLPENKAEKWISPTNCKFFNEYHKLQLSRVYPHALRIDSSNYDPVKMWNAGVQMAALNYQTSDRAMQLNQGKFLDNGACGYILKPDFMFSESPNLFDVYKKECLLNVKSLSLSLRIISGRHLVIEGKRYLNPFVEVEIIGADYDNSKYKTATIDDNGLNPIWDEIFYFYVNCPDLALIRFVVFNEDVFGDSNFIGQATYPLNCLRQGYRSVPLKNEYSEDLELSALLVHLEIKDSINN